MTSEGTTLQQRIDTFFLSIKLWSFEDGAADVRLIATGRPEVRVIPSDCYGCEAKYTYNRPVLANDLPGACEDGWLVLVDGAKPVQFEAFGQALAHAFEIFDTIALEG